MGAAAQQKARRRATARQRRYRDRMRSGRVLVSIEADEACLSAKLVDLGRLNPLHADDPKAIGKALQKLVEELVVVDVLPT